jgi:hypothetical protein
MEGLGRSRRGERPHGQDRKGEGIGEGMTGEADARRELAADENQNRTKKMSLF